MFENDRPDSDSLITIRNTNGEGGKMKRKSSYRVVLKSSKIVESLCVKEASRREGDDRLVFVLQITVKDEERELKKRLSDIRSLFHQINAHNFGESCSRYQLLPIWSRDSRSPKHGSLVELWLRL